MATSFENQGHHNDQAGSKTDLRYTGAQAEQTKK
jgi:hypothetical protein